MHSIRAKITALTVSAIIAAITVTTVISTLEIKNPGNRTSNQMLYLVCEESKKTLDDYFKSVEQSVKTVSSYAEQDLKHSDSTDLSSHIDRVEDLFEKTANNTKGILTYYYRIDPEISAKDKGFWYVNLDKKGFKKHEVTDITLYDTNDQSQLVWFTVPKATGSSVWLPPYFTDNLDVYVLSYNVPVKKDGKFIGVIGIEIDYDTIIAPIKNMSIYKNGYAFINDVDGNIIYHPRMDISDYTSDPKPKVPDGLLSHNTYLKYTYEGVSKQAVWRPLENGMRINVTVPINEINSGWISLTNKLISISVLLLLLFVLLTTRLAVRITRPLKKLTEATAQVDEGNYDVELNYDRDDEVGALTKTFNQLISHLKVYIQELNDLAYSDPLTSVHNKGAFDIYIRDIQQKINDKENKPEFAIGIFDCNNLKVINDRFGHEKGDLYLQASVCLICTAFPHSPVFRIGGDEFAVILINDDYKNRDKLEKAFNEQMLELSSKSDLLWKKISLAEGIAVYDPETDRSAEDVIRRADELMYKKKEQQKKDM
ncbi:MAG: diguanylate cyclase [Clostridia bacterium]|nr:diguanylate cyclase [Clostridia bacterium]